MTLQETITKAAEKRVAIGHFNVATLEMYNAVIDACRETELPVIVGVSEGERDFMGIKNIVALIKEAQSEGLPVFLNADHTYKVEKAKEAIDAGFDAVIIDSAALSYEENVAHTKEVVAYARERAPHILIEAELGYIGSGSAIIEKAPEGVDEDHLTDPAEALRYVEETGINLLAPAVGNMHGMFKDRSSGKLNIELIKALREKAGVPLVLHGGSGTSEEDFLEAAKAGMPIIHVSTELRVAFREGIEATIKEKPDEIAPYRLLAEARSRVKEVAKNRLILFAKGA